MKGDVEVSFTIWPDPLHNMFGTRTPFHNNIMKGDVGMASDSNKALSLVQW